ncbi:MAG: DMT family transporter [Deltaproteobacteria bacterium]|jgi:drug/metabolite transporter (DMT)-like permease|nr:DMT family transporter [Deltaproteobacteria bacterium]
MPRLSDDQTGLSRVPELRARVPFRITTKRAALWTLALTALLWSSSGILVKSVHWNPMAVASARGLVSGLTIWVLSAEGFRPRRLTRYHVLSGMCLCMLSVCFISAMTLTTAANTVILQFTAPVWVALFAPLVLKERTRGRDWAFISVIFGGIFLFFMDELSPGRMLGNLLAIVSGVFFAALALSLRLVKDDSPVQGMILGNFLCFLAGLWFWRAPFPDGKGILMLVLLGVFQLGISYWLYTLALPKAGALELVMITMLEPVLSPLWVFLLMGERPGPWALAGGLVVLGSVFSWSVLKAREEEPAVNADGGAGGPPASGLDLRKDRDGQGSPGPAEGTEVVRDAPKAGQGF